MVVCIEHLFAPVASSLLVCVGGCGWWWPPAYPSPYPYLFDVIVLLPLLWLQKA